MTIIEKYLRAFEAYYADEMEPGKKLAFEKQLESDTAIKAAWEEYLAMMKAFSDKEAVSLRIKLEKAYDEQYRISRSDSYNKLLIRISVAAMILVVMGLLLYFFCSSGVRLQKDHVDHSVVVPENKKIEMAITDSVHEEHLPGSESLITNEHKAEQIASIFDDEKYQISPVFTELLHNVYRSAWFRINSPEDSVMFSSGEALVFSWETNITLPLYFDVLDRHGQVVYKHATPITEPWTYYPELAPAIYMYRFATEAQPVWMGVMVVVNDYIK